MRSLVLLAFAAAACSAGSGPATQLPLEKRDPAVGSEPAPGGRESPGAGQDPGAGGDRNAGSGSGASCPACDYVYACVETNDVGSVNEDLTLVTQGGACIFLDSTTVTFKCDGQIVQTTTGQPTLIVPWTVSANGGFAFTAKGQHVVCTPKQPYTPTPLD